MYDLAVREERWAAADTLIRRKFGDQAVPYGDRVLFAFARKDTAAQRQLLVEGPRIAGEKGRRIGDKALEAGSWLAIYLEELDRAKQFASLDTVPSVVAGTRASTHRFLGNLNVAGGRWAAARDEFRMASRLGQSDSALVGRALAAALPFLAVPKGEIESIRTEVERWKPGSDPSAPLPASVRALTGPLRLYLLGLLSARLGEAAKALGYAGVVQTMAATAPSETRALVQGLARTIRADVAAGAGRRDEALSLLDDVRGQVPFELIRLPYFSEEHARYLRDRLLHLVGRDEEALRLAEVAFVGTPNEMHYRAPIHLLRAEIEQKLGHRAAAAEQYSQFIGLWRSCDPPLRPVVEGAKTELARLVAEPR
jgi:tetratricopeptide (TPR) repeat protein